MTDYLDSDTVKSEKAKSAHLIEMVNRHGQVTIKFKRSQCQRFLGVAKDTTVLESVTILDAPQGGPLSGIMLVVFANIFCNYVYEIIDFLYKGKDRVTGMLEKEGNGFALRIRLNEPKNTKLELVANNTSESGATNSGPGLACSI